MKQVKGHCVGWVLPLKESENDDDEALRERRLCILVNEKTLPR